MLFFACFHHLNKQHRPESYEYEEETKRRKIIASIHRPILAVAFIIRRERSNWDRASFVIIDAAMNSLVDSEPWSNYWKRIANIPSVTRSIFFQSTVFTVRKHSANITVRLQRIRAYLY
jgi:hypothetical protein